MTVQVQRIPAHAWITQFSEHAHRIAFGEIMPKTLERIDYALLAVTEKESLMYVTCREIDEHSLYCQFGGAMPGAKGTPASREAADAIMAWIKSRYQRMGFMCENENYPMIRLAVNLGFKIVGLRNVKGSVLLEHLVEFASG